MNGYDSSNIAQASQSLTSVDLVERFPAIICEPNEKPAPFSLPIGVAELSKDKGILS